VEIRAWFHPGDDAPVMWSCTECKRKFVPIDLAIEREKIHSLSYDPIAVWAPEIDRKG
jgi:hypothetical protein